MTRPENQAEALEGRPVERQSAYEDRIERLNPIFYIRWTSGPNYERAYLCVEDGEPDMNAFAEVSFGLANIFKAGMQALAALPEAPAVPVGGRLYDGDAPMADGEERMTAAENVLAWLIIEKIGVPDDETYTPREAQDILARAIDQLHEYEVSALQSSPPVKAAAVDGRAYGWTLVSDRHLNALASALAEIKATNDGNSDQPIGVIIDWCLGEIDDSESPTQWPALASQNAAEGEAVAWGDSGPIPGQHFGDEFSPRPPAADAGVREALERALKPFAHIANGYDDTLDPDDRPVGPLHLGLCRGARAALSLAAKREQP